MWHAIYEHVTPGPFKVKHHGNATNMDLLIPLCVKCEPVTPTQAKAAEQPTGPWREIRMTMAELTLHGSNSLFVLIKLCLRKASGFPPGTPKSRLWAESTMSGQWHASNHWLMNALPTTHQRLRLCMPCHVASPRFRGPNGPFLKGFASDLVGRKARSAWSRPIYGSLTFNTLPLQIFPAPTWPHRMSRRSDATASAKQPAVTLETNWAKIIHN